MVASAPVLVEIEVEVGIEIGVGRFAVEFVATVNALGTEQKTANHPQTGPIPAAQPEGYRAEPASDLRYRAAGMAKVAVRDAGCHWSTAATEGAVFAVALAKRELGVVIEHNVPRVADASEP